ncbi:FAD-dependent oxidoreductase [Ferrimicrobium sp.]|uniref:FAD-dependent oxidoreductase n=1 Tax=Ferrimicrobium sp. TaxID=2926050 RepID=UPI002604EB0E|nr:FAD-dependent oxidoreductase [Ferrimicrobium sp.]
MRVVVIGAGATGLGVAWDLVLRGIETTVVEAQEIGSGTSGRFHGLLHSGGRYLVTDPSAAKECYEENMLLREIANEAVVATGGYFVKKYGDDDAFEARWLNQAADLGVPVHAEKVGDLRAELGMLTESIQRSYWVPDGVLEGFKMLSMLVRAIQSRGSNVLEHTKAVKLRLAGERVNGVEVQAPEGTRVLDCDAVVNTAGPWAGLVARDWGLDVKVQPSYGLMLIFANRRLDKVVNRLKSPSDGDIFVPHQEVVILGTTDVAQPSPEAPEPRRSEAIRLMALGSELIPDLGSWRVLRGFNGVRPLYEPSGVTGDSRKVSRDFAVLDHGERDGLAGAFSVLGGKWTTFRLMGETLGDQLVASFNVDSPSRSREVPIGVEVKRPAPVVKDDRGALLCECEQVYESDIKPTVSSPMQLRFGTWFSMGPCQGTFCAHRVLGRGDEDGFADELATLRREREHGLTVVGWGANARLIALEQSISAQSLGEER